MFQLEAVKAMHGDCLLLHWGTAAKPGVALIDGGPSGIYRDHLRPRLLDLIAQRGAPLKLDLMMLSHIDDDHINGLLDLAKAVEDKDIAVSIGRLWHNSLEGLLDTSLAGGGGQVTASAAADMASHAKNPWMAQVLASVPQGQELFGYARRLGLSDTMNAPFQPLVRRGQGLPPSVSLKGLKLTVLSPTNTELEELRKKWKALRKESATAAYSDPSPYNLSSIVVLAEYGKKRMLLTGDARGDHVLDGLAALGLLDANGGIDVDLLKLPHHGSHNNVEIDFFKRVRAKTYVVSGDFVKFKNPAQDTMAWLAEARRGATYKVVCTYDLPHMRTTFGDRLAVPAVAAHSVVAKA